ncbi:MULTISPECIES: YbaY family lipoprotein [unclassified Paludibacterium]|uniref:YbaY family lipoprotein n=1 Tax=unclassified Paludibacterium TaxID=2618429 RepID=UPI001C04BD03|nr:YbaY family lipoprotein [Paludibacterium sp. B53371]BEV73703.1 hypothetical protein THUN1379_31850 [Paludibacterium sp. THUN1379]
MLSVKPLLTALSCALLLAACASTPYQPASLNGNIQLPASLMTAKELMVRQRLLDVSGSGGAASVLSEQFINRPQKNPLVYALPYDRQAIHSGGHYEIDTQVYAGGELRAHATQALTAGSDGLPATADVQAQPVGQ